MRNNIHFALIIIIVFFSCNKKKTNVLSFTEFPETIQKTTTVKEFPFKIQAFEIFTVEDIIIVVNIWTETGYYFTFFDKTTMKFLGQTGKRGKAPNEIVRAMHPTINSQDKKIYIADYGRNIDIFEFDIIESMKDTAYMPVKLFEIGTEKMYVMNLIYCDNGIFMHNYYKNDEDLTDYYYTFTDKNGKNESSFEPLPYKKVMPIEIYCEISERESIYRNGRIFTTFEYHDKLVSFDVKDKKKIFEIDGPDFIEPEIEIHAGHWIPLNIARTNAYFSVTASDDFVYCLYSGKSGTRRNRTPRGANTIHVFDYKGNPVQKIEIDQAVNQITYDDQTNSLVGIQNDEKTGMDTQGLVWIKL